MSTSFQDRSTELSGGEVGPVVAVPSGTTAAGPARSKGRESVVVYRWCGEHQHVEKGRRFRDGRVTITHPPELASAHEAT